MATLPEAANPNPRARTLVPAGDQPIALAEHVRVARAGAPAAGNSVEDWIAHLIDRAGMRWRGTWASQSDSANRYLFGDLVRDGDELWVWGNEIAPAHTVRPGSGTSSDDWELVYEPPRAWFRGAWSADARYEGNDWAEWNGQLFRAIHDIFPATNNPVPANSGDWQPIDLWRGVWDGHGRYAPGSIVTANGQLWMADTYLDEHSTGPGVTAHWHRISTPQAAQLAALLETLTGNARLDYNALDNTPDGAALADLIEALAGDDRLNYERLRNQPRVQHIDGWQVNRSYIPGDLTVWNEMLFRCTSEVSSVHNPNVDPDNWNPIENYRGAWNDHNAYSIASFVSHAGHLYVSTIQFDPTPGETTNEPGHHVSWVQISPQSPAQIVQNLVALAGDDRLPYSAIRGTPAPSTFTPRTDDEIQALMEIAAQRGNTNRWEPAKLGSGTRNAGTVLHGDGAFRTTLLRGIWSATTDYAVHDVVLYGAVFYRLTIALDADTRTVIPPAGFNWSPITGAGLYDSATPVAHGQIIRDVTQPDALWYARSSIGAPVQRPSVMSNEWARIDAGAVEDHYTILPSAVGTVGTWSALNAPTLPLVSPAPGHIENTTQFALWEWDSPVHSGTSRFTRPTHEYRWQSAFALPVGTVGGTEAGVEVIYTSWPDSASTPTVGTVHLARTQAADGIHHQLLVRRQATPVYLRCAIMT